MKLLTTLIITLIALIPAHAEKNEVSGYIQFGDNIVQGFYAGINGFYKRQMSSRFDLTGGLSFSTKNPQGFGGIMADGTYRIPVNRANFLISNRLVYNYYGAFNMNEFLYRLAVTWQTRYVEFTLGNSFLTYFSLGSHVFEPITWSVGFAAHLKPRECSWNIGLYIKNFDDFIYENYNINFGFDGRYRILKNWDIFGILMVRPAGSMNQLAVKYDTSFKLGVKYKW
ncbi:MAG: hypothetical protein RR254_00165 [Muribaculaceae bacterium]